MRISDWSSDVCSSDLSVISASTGRPGPSVLDLGFQVLVSPTACVAEPLELPEPPAASQKSIDRAMEIITSAQNPVLFVGAGVQLSQRSEEHTSELQSLMRISYAVFCLKKNKTKHPN